MSRNGEEKMNYFFEWREFARDRGLGKSFDKECGRGNFHSMVEKLNRLEEFERKTGLQSPAEAIKNLDWQKLAYDLNLEGGGEHGRQNQ